MTDRDEVHEFHIGMADILRRLDSIDARFERIERVVFVGNGQPSMTQRIASIESGQGKVSIAVLLSMLGAIAGFFKDGLIPPNR